ncbi:MAG: response regulator, partial [Elusimicrobia bacterium]|nr:response regulator [Elusimicrobiota bacterium]
EAVRAIRSNPKTKHIPILMCTGENKVEDIDESLRAGADDYIPKPINLARLKAKCAKLLGPRPL